MMMSCNGCRVLRKGCNESCLLRQSLQSIHGAPAQTNATVFVARFFGRAALMSFLSAVPLSQRPAVFRSLLFEACGRTVNPVNGAVGLLCTGNWHVCEAAVATVLRGGSPLPLQDYFNDLDLGLTINNPPAGTRGAGVRGSGHAGEVQKRKPETPSVMKSVGRDESEFERAEREKAIIR